MSYDIQSFSLDFFNLKGKTAIVTGGNTGIGEGLVVALAKAGTNVFIPSIISNSSKDIDLLKKMEVK